MGILALVALLTWVGLYQLTFESLNSNDQLDYGQLARRLLATGKHHTDIILPLYLTRFATLLEQPEFLRAPGFIWLVAGAQLVFGETDFAMLFNSLLAYVLIAVLVFVLAYQFSASRALAFAAGVLAIANAELLSNSQNGLPDLLFTAYTTGLFCLLISKHNKPIWMGVYLGIGYLLRYNTAFFAPGVVLFYIFDQRWDAIKTLLWIAVGGALTVAPWLYRNYALAHSPFFAWNSFNYVMGTPDFPDQELYRQITEVDIGAYVRSHPTVFFKKVMRGVLQMYRELPQITNIFIVAPFVAALLLSRRLPTQLKHLSWATILMIAVQAIALTPMQHERTRLFLVFVPLMIALGLFFLWQEIDKKRTFGIVVSIMLVASLFPTVLLYIDPNNRPDYLEIQAEWQTLDAPIADSALIISDASHPLAWYFGHTTVRIPTTLADLNTIDTLAAEEGFSDVYVYLYYMEDKDRYDRQAEYEREFLTSAEFLAEYSLIQTFESGAMLFQQIEETNSSAN